MILAGQMYQAGWNKGDRLRFAVRLPVAPMATRALMFEHPHAIEYIRFGYMNQTIAEAWNDRDQLEVRGGLAVMPFTHYWARERRWRDFGALMVPPNVAQYTEAEVQLSARIDGGLRAYALAYATARSQAEVLDLSQGPAEAVRP